MATGAAWVLNLDADLELASGPRYTPSRSVLAAMRPHITRLALELLSPADVLVEDGVTVDASGRIGRAFCPTPRAVALLQRAGANVAPHPPVEVLREVNGRAFCAALGPTLPGGRFNRDLDEARAQLGSSPHVAERWRVKRNFGMAGRGQRVMPPVDLPFLRASFPAGVQIEPNVDIDTEYAIHGVVAVDGTCELGRVVRQRCDARGQWQRTEPTDVLPTIAERLLTEARSVARALHRAGYFGPFGIDAFTYGDGALQPRSEINARYSMGFAVGMSLRPPSPRAGGEGRE